MQKSGIEWTDYTINPVKGKCPMACPYCYARRMYDRFKWNPEIRFDVKPLLSVEKIKQPSRIFVGSTMELFDEWVDAFWLDSIFHTVKKCPPHTFLFLTKCPQNLLVWSPFPKNCYVGVSVTGKPNDLATALLHLKQIECGKRYISFEPLLASVSVDLPFYEDDKLDWVIIGGQSGSKKFFPPEEWIAEIELAADKIRIPIFEKDNLRKVLDKPPRQEIP